MHAAGREQAAGLAAAPARAPGQEIQDPGERRIVPEHRVHGLEALGVGAVLQVAMRFGRERNQGDGDAPRVLRDNGDDAAHGKQRELRGAQVDDASTNCKVQDDEDRDAEPAPINHDVERAETAPRFPACDAYP
jgi:hypothetical protein